MTSTLNEPIYVTYSGIVLLREDKHRTKEALLADRLAAAKRLAPVIGAMGQLRVLGGDSTYRIVPGHEVTPVRVNSPVLPRYYGVAGCLRALHSALRETLPAGLLARVPDVAILASPRIAEYGVFLHDDQQRVWGYNADDYV